MFTDSKEWNDELVRDFIDIWYNIFIVKFSLTRNKLF